MADSANETPGRSRAAARGPATDAARPTPDPAGPDAEPATGGLTAILDKLRDAAAAHDDEVPEEPPAFRAP
jgi:hypothetical protein